MQLDLRAFAPFEPSPLFAVAVSGGADSMALCLLLHAWAQEHSGQILALTVDHKLRPESGAEAQQVAQWLSKRGIEHHILPYTGSWQEGNIQAQAREVRYRLMADFCTGRGILHLFTAHHQDDQLETYAMRRRRGSGVAGLSAMKPISAQHGVRILRPLLDIPKSALEAYLKTQQQPWIDDPSNDSPKYQRTSVRKELQSLFASQSAKRTEMLQAIAEAAQENAEWETKLAQAAVQLVSVFPWGEATLRWDSFLTLPDELRFRLLKSLLACISGNATLPRQETINALLRQLEKQRRTNCHGCALHYVKDRMLHILREPAAISSTAHSISALPDQRWDNRFRIVPHGTFSSNQLYCSANIASKAYLKALQPARILRTLPALYTKPECSLESLCAIPHINWYRSENAKQAAAALTMEFSPSRALS